MSISEKEELNNTQGDVIQVSCSKCSGKTYHEVIQSVDKSGEEHDGDFDLYWDVHYQIIQCQGCKAISFRQTDSNSEDNQQTSYDTLEAIVYENLYPSRIEGRKGIEDEALYLPAKVQRIYKETLQALNNSSPVLAGIGLRALVETICKEKNADGENLYHKIDDLVTKNILTPAGVSILHKIRTLGNDSAHEVKPHHDKQLEIAMDVIEHLLKDIYILPKKMASEFGNS